MVRRQADGPALPLYLSEPGRAVADFGLYLAARPLVAHLPRGDGHPVLVFPGLLGDDVSTRALRAVLRRLDYRVHGWGLGRNIGPTAACVAGMRDKVDYLNDRYGRPVSLIGWSLGGIFARDLARRSPDAVRQVITLGSPFRTVEGHHRRPLTVPSTSIYTRDDGVVRSVMRPFSLRRGVPGSLLVSTVTRPPVRRASGFRCRSAASTPFRCRPDMTQDTFGQHLPARMTTRG